MEAVLVAVVTAFGGILAILVQKGRTENKDDHGHVMDKLIEVHKDVHHIEIKVDAVESKIDEHLSVDHPASKVKPKKK